LLEVEKSMIKAINISFTRGEESGVTKAFDKKIKLTMKKIQNWCINYDYRLKSKIN